MGRTALAALLLAVAIVPSAAAQEDGVFVDPDSPAGKEYQIPLQEARRQAAGVRGGDGNADPSSGQPLFGEGIERATGAGGGAAGGASGDGGGSGTGAGSAPGGKQSAPREGGEGGAPAARDIPPNSRHSAAIEAAAAGGSDGLMTVGIAAAVLAAGLLAGLGLRRLLKAR